MTSTESKLAVAIVKRSSAFACKQVTFEVDDQNDVNIKSNNDYNTWGATELCVQLASFSQYFFIDSEDGKITLKVY